MIMPRAYPRKTPAGCDPVRPFAEMRNPVRTAARSPTVESTTTEKEIPMSTIDQLLSTHPLAPEDAYRAKLAACIAACLECVQACTTCADACLNESSPADMVRCITTCLDCAEICAATASVLSRLSERDPAVVRAQVEACRTACGACAAECEQHAGMHEHCRVCAEVCRRCEKACAELLSVLG